MTTRQDYRNDFLFLQLAKELDCELKSCSDYNQKIKKSILLIISCHIALETYLYRIYIKSNCFEFYDKLTTIEMVSYLFTLKNTKCDFGSEPFQIIDQIVKKRNKLIHFKLNEDVGLTGSDINSLCFLEPNETNKLLQEILKLNSKLYPCTINSLIKLSDLYSFMDDKNIFIAEDFKFLLPNQ